MIKKLNDNQDLEYYKNLIRDHEFASSNPFDLAVDIINNNTEIPDIVLEQFKTFSYITWADMVYTGEARAVDVYKFIFNLFENNEHRYFKNFTEEQKVDINNFFKDTIEEEDKHTNLVEYLFTKCNYKFLKITEENKLTDPVYKNTIKNFCDEKNLLTTMVTFYMGEVQILTTLSLLIKYTTNDDKKNFLKVILQEESKHVNGFLKLMELIKKNINHDELAVLDDFYKNKRPFNFEYFGLLHIKGFFDQCKYHLLKNQTTKKDLVRKIKESIIQNKFQQEYNQSYNKRFYKYYQVFFPHITEVEYNNHNLGTVNSLFDRYQLEFEK
jgi:rubrerythrin